MQTLQIDIVSDIACPWCAIGYARLEKAMTLLADELSFKVEWHAFELNPDPAAPAEPILQALSRKYGREPAQVEAAQADMMQIASALGLNFDRLQERYTRNTFDGHRLVKWAGEQGRQTEMKQALFEAYFGHAENIADAEVLVRCAAAAGLDPDAARAVLDSDGFVQAVREDEEHYRQAGVSAVPAFIINGQYLVSGAQEPDYLVGAFRQIASAGA